MCSYPHLTSSEDKHSIRDLSKAEGSPSEMLWVKIPYFNITNTQPEGEAGTTSCTLADIPTQVRFKAEVSLPGPQRQP